MAKQVPLTRGQFTTVDDEDYELVMQYTWHAAKEGNNYRPERRPNKKCPYRFMYQLIMNNKWVDHIDGNPLNNTKQNLRLCTPAENQHNRRKGKNNTSGYKGVTYDSRTNQQLNKRWKATIRITKEKKYISKTLGRFFTAEEAAKAYDDAAIKYFGEFAYLNFSKTN